MRPSALGLALVVCAAGCAPGTNPAPDASATDAAAAEGSSSDTASGPDAALDAAADAATGDPDATCAPVDAGSPPEGGVVSNLRGVRYCEVLLATLMGSAVHVDVYNTLGLSDCPQDAWAALDPAALSAQNMVSAVVLNGPRYWVIDGLENSALLDPTVREFGCIPTRLAGRLDAPVSELSAMRTPYTPLSVMRETHWVFAAGAAVYELLDPSGHVYDMQSYSVQTTAQTEASLATLGSRLSLPTGWTFRTRTLDAELIVTAVGGLATVVQDDFGNTYQLSQQ